jgi:hypothetical protein
MQRHGLSPVGCHNKMGLLSPIFPHNPSYVDSPTASGSLEGGTFLFLREFKITTVTGEPANLSQNHFWATKYRITRGIFNLHQLAEFVLVTPVTEVRVQTAIMEDIHPLAVSVNHES